MSSHHGNSVQIEAPKFDPDLDGDSPAYTDKKHGKVPVQGTLATIPETSEPEDEDSIAPGTNTDQQNYQETDWPDAPPHADTKSFFINSSAARTRIQQTSSPALHRKFGNTRTRRKLRGGTIHRF